MSISEKLVTIAENQQRVFDAGRNSGGGGDYDSGYNDGYDSGYGDGYMSGYDSGYWGGYGEGQTAEYDRFWDAFQQNGKRNWYDQAFSGVYCAWDEDSYNPKYDILCEGENGARQTFYANKLTSTKVPIRFKDTRLVFTFQNSTLLKTIPLLVLEDVYAINNAFTGCTSLENITIAGEIPLSIAFQNSANLTKDSITSIVNALSTTASGQTLTLSSTAVTNAFGSTTASAWTSLINTRSNWTISLV